VQGSTVTFTVVLRFTANSPPAVTPANFIIAQQGNNRVQCDVKQILAISTTSITFTCSTNKLPQGNHKYYAQYLPESGGCLAPAKSSPLPQIKIWNK